MYSSFGFGMANSELILSLAQVIVPLMIIAIIALVLGIYGAATTSYYRKEGWRVLKGKNWLAIGVTVVAGIIGGIESFMSGGGNANVSTNVNSYTRNFAGSDASFGFGQNDPFFGKGMLDSSFWAVLLGVFAVVMVVISIFMIVRFIIGSGLVLGYNDFYIKRARGEQVTFSTLFSKFKQLGRVIGMRLLRKLFIFLWSLLTLIPVAVFAWIIVRDLPVLRTYSDPVAVLTYIMPKVIYLLLAVIVLDIPTMIATLKYSMSAFVMADDSQIPPMEAIRKSRDLMRGHKWKLYLLQIGFIGWAILLGLAAGIAVALAAVSPVLAVLLSPAVMLFSLYIQTNRSSTYAVFYLTLTGQRIAREEAEAPQILTQELPESQFEQIAPEQIAPEQIAPEQVVSEQIAPENTDE